MNQLLGLQSEPGWGDGKGNWVIASEDDTTAYLKANFSGWNVVKVVAEVSVVTYELGKRNIQYTMQINWDGTVPNPTSTRGDIILEIPKDRSLEVAMSLQKIKLI